MQGDPTKLVQQRLSGIGLVWVIIVCIKQITLHSPLFVLYGLTVSALIVSPVAKILLKTQMMWFSCLKLRF